MMRITDMTPPFYTDKQIEYAAQAVLDDYQKQQADLEVGAVPIEDILDHMGLRIEVDDFTRDKYFGVVGEHVLGFIKFEEKAVYVNRLLDPIENPDAHEGRFHFTLAHEVGHYCLHKELFEDYNHQMSFMNEAQANMPALLCRSPETDMAENKPRPFIEQHADKFASYMLMPKNLIIQAWQEEFGTDAPLTRDELVKTKDILQTSDGAIRHVIAPMAEKFSVSVTAMRIRLEKMKLITDGSQPYLF